MQNNSSPCNLVLSGPVWPLWSLFCPPDRECHLSQLWTDHVEGSHRDHFSCPCSRFQVGRKSRLLRPAVLRLCKPVGLAAWPLLQRPTFPVDTWRVESRSWPRASFQEQVAVGTAKGGWAPFAFFVPVEERTFTCRLGSLGKAPRCFQ